MWYVVLIDPDSPEKCLPLLGPFPDRDSAHRRAWEVERWAWRYHPHQRLAYKDFAAVECPAYDGPGLINLRLGIGVADPLPVPTAAPVKPSRTKPTAKRRRTAKAPPAVEQIADGRYYG